MHKDVKRRVKWLADQIVNDCLYFGYYELDDEDVVKLADICNLNVQTICKILRIRVPKNCDHK